MAHMQASLRGLAFGHQIHMLVREVKKTSHRLALRLPHAELIAAG
jgi:hypothetical protein